MKRLKAGVRRCEMKAMVCFALGLTLGVVRLLPGYPLLECMVEVAF